MILVGGVSSITIIAIAINSLDYNKGHKDANAGGNIGFLLYTIHYILYIV